MFALPSSSVLGAKVVWNPVGELVAGDDHVHQVIVPATGSAQFIRLESQVERAASVQEPSMRATAERWGN